MRLIKFLLLTVIVVIFIVLGVANMTPVDLKMLPAFLGRDDLQIRNIPLAAIILVSFLAGLLIGLLIEFLRETRHRTEASRRRREVGKLKKEVTVLARKAGEEDEFGLPVR